MVDCFNEQASGGVRLLPAGEKIAGHKWPNGDWSFDRVVGLFALLGSSCLAALWGALVFAVQIPPRPSWLMPVGALWALLGFGSVVSVPTRCGCAPGPSQRSVLPNFAPSLCWPRAAVPRVFSTLGLRRLGYSSSVGPLSVFQSGVLVRSLMLGLVGSGAPMD